MATLVDANLLDVKDKLEIPRGTALSRGLDRGERFRNALQAVECRKHVLSLGEAGTKRQISRSFDVTSLSLIGAALTRRGNADWTV